MSDYSEGWQAAIETAVATILNLNQTYLLIDPADPQSLRWVVEQAILDHVADALEVLGNMVHGPGFDTSADRKLAAARPLLTAALDKLAEYGWVQFGTNAHNGVPVTFSRQVNEEGHPWFERVTEIC